MQFTGPNVHPKNHKISPIKAMQRIYWCLYFTDKPSNFWLLLMNLIVKTKSTFDQMNCNFQLNFHIDCILIFSHTWDIVFQCFGLILPGHAHVWIHRPRVVEIPYTAKPAYKISSWLIIQSLLLQGRPHITHLSSCGCGRRSADVKVIRDNHVPINT